MIVGTNAQPQQGFPPEDIATSGVKLVRFPLWRGFDYRPFFDGLRSAGAEPVPILDRRAFTEAEWLNRRYLTRLRAWFQIYPDIVYLQCGNEPDQAGGSSSSMARADYYRLLRNARSVWPVERTWILGAGLARIDFSYYDNAPSEIDCFHPYTQDDESVVGLVSEVRKHTSKPLWATEVGVPVSFYPTLHERAEWHSQMLIALSQLGIAAAIQFPYGKVMETSFDGMVDLAGDITEVWAAVSGAASALASE